jgi:hypothetical protein
LAASAWAVRLAASRLAMSPKRVYLFMGRHATCARGGWQE